MRGVCTAEKPVILVKGSCLFVFGIDQKCVGADVGFGSQTPINGKANENFTQTGSTAFHVARKSAHAEARNGVAWQFFAVWFRDLLNANLCGTQGVETQYRTRACTVHHHKNRTDAFCGLLGCIFFQKIVKCGLSATKGGAVMPFGVKDLLLKHA